MSLITLQDITKIFNRGRPDEFTALSKVDLEIESCRLAVFRGPSGSGKTTLLSVVGCMTKPTAGRVFVQGREVTSLSERFLTDIRRHTFGFIFQQFHLLRGISALENVILPAYPSGEKLSVLKKRGKRLLDLLELSPRATASVEWLSGGEAQRVAIARALINDPFIVIADEPTAHLDTKLSRDFMAIMERLKSEGKTILVTSHDPLIYESATVDRVLDMRDGRILSERQGT
ncbi:putative ABC transport system ATP-binding protein [Syntrophus gentianae]|uniref:Putative ABC transport system ATP-binding protein n=1 Tax=Syntrophus gentianae TaxID=43775 RepID=A0A1H8AFG5_9BACT|nr:ABC transporter ATP-binding protein [Syntrophus gentianae]SEM68539.1 putative ABC transport system ATP-binding protein [Syntrophus gentianae]